jgi:hypothetical protein
MSTTVGRAAPQAVPRSRLRALSHPGVGLLALLVVLASAALLWLTLLPPRSFSLDIGGIGSADRVYLRGFYHRETADRFDPAARTWRWARGDAELLLPVGQVAPAIFAAELHAAPQSDGRPLPFAMWAGPTALRFDVDEVERRYLLLLPGSAVERGRIRLRFDSPTVTPPGDDRLLAVAVDRVGLRPTSLQAVPSLWLLLTQLLAVGAAGALLRTNRASWPWAIAVAGGVALLFAALNLGARYWIGLGAAPLAWVAGTLAAASLGVQALIRRADTAEAVFIRRLWLLSLGGLALRLIGVSAPGFAFNDLDIQSKVLGQVVDGQLYQFLSAHEFGGGKSFYLTGPYLLALPLLLIQPTMPFALHLGAAAIDACGPPLLALIARELCMSRRAALIAGGLLAVLPIMLTALWWGFFTNIGGQALLLLLLWLLLRHTRAPSRWSAALLFLGLSLVLLSHVGVLTLTGTAGLLALGLIWMRPRLSAAAWRGLALAGLGALTMFVIGYLSIVAAPMLGSTQSVLTNEGRLSAERLVSERAYIARILPVAVWRGTGMLPFLALLPGIPLLLRQARRPLGRPLILAWLLTPLLFVVVEWIYLVQVRYLYFVAPLCCLALAAVLSALWQRRAARPVVIAALALIAWLGVALWFNGAIVGIKMSLVPLTH